MGKGRGDAEDAQGAARGVTHTHTCLGAALFDYWSDGHGVSAHDGLKCPVQLKMADLGLLILCLLLPRTGIICVCYHSQFMLGMESRAQWMLG